MVRAVLIFSVVLALAWCAAWLANNPGLLVIEWQGVRVETTFTVGIALIALLCAGVLLFYNLVMWVLGRTAALGSFFALQRGRRAREALSKGFLAVAVGDAAKARRHLQQASAAKGDPALLLLLRAQTADLCGQSGEAETVYSEMLETSATRLTGLMGLMAHAKAKGDVETARTHAEKAFQLAPTAEPTFKALFELQTAAADWQAARRTVDAARRSGLIGQSAAARRTAVLMTAQAMDLRASGKIQAAGSMAQRALSQSPDCLPAAIVAAEAFQRLGKRARTAALIVNAWPRIPHPDLGRIFTELNTRENDVARWRRVTGLVELKRDHAESRLLFARQALKAERYQAARDALRPLLEPAPTARVAELMAKLEEAETGNRAEAELWHDKAAHAPRDALWRCRTCGRQAAQWTPECPQCHSFDSQFWKSLGDRDLLAQEAEDMTPETSAADDTRDENGDFVFSLFGRSKKADSKDGEETPDAPPETALKATHILKGNGKAEDFTQAANDGNTQTDEEPVLSLPAPEPRADSPETPGQPSVNGDATPRRTKERNEPVIYVSPRPPDDPGPSEEPGSDPNKW